MTEDEARASIAERYGDAAADRIGRFLTMVAEENVRQNLVSPSTVDLLCSRHALDSAQLLALAPSGATSWIDVGTGGGFPGIIVALLFDGVVTMVEPRRRRADFLSRCVVQLQLANAVVIQKMIEKAQVEADVISARAVASVEKLLQAAAHCARPGTRWILPRGRIDDATLEFLGRDRRMMFHVEHSLTDAQSSILVIDGIVA